jgi:hypothetical protein
MTTSAPGLGGWLKRTFGHHETNEETHEGNATTGGDLHQEPVVVWEAANSLEAQVVKGRLESEGIPAIVRGEAVGALYGLTTGGLAATDVLVPAALAEKATQILNEEMAVDVESEPDDSAHPAE